MGKFQRYGIKFAKVHSGYRSPYNRTGLVALQSRKSKTISKSGVKGPISTRQEINFVDTAISTTALSTAGSITLINGISEGDDNTNRNGKKCVIKSVQVHGVIRASAGTNVASPRSVLIWDNSPNGVLPAITDIFTSDSTYAYPNVNNVARFSILKDCHPDPAFGTAPTTSTTFMPVEYYKKMNDATRFLGTGATIASIQNGALYIVCWGTAASVNTSAVELNTRVRFLEK